MLCGSTYVYEDVFVIFLNGQTFQYCCYSCNSFLVAYNKHIGYTKPLIVNGQTKEASPWMRQGPLVAQKETKQSEGLEKTITVLY